MSLSLSNYCITRPLSSPSFPRINSTYNHVPFSRFPQFLKPPTNSKNHYNTIKAVAGNGSNNLDHLQRSQLPQQQQPQQQLPKKRVYQVAPTGLWDRFPTARTVQQMIDTMDRIMEDPFVYSGTWPSPSPGESGGYRRGRTPWEIKEGEKEYKMRFDMPGMTKEDVKVFVEEKMLVVKADKVTTESDEEEWSAKSYGRYSSRIALPENVDFQKIKAEVKDGVLYITVPKASSAAKILDINVQ